MTFQGIDIGDLFRPESTLTLRRLWGLIRALPPEAPLWASIKAAEEKANKPTPDLIRERQAAFEARNAQRLATEAPHG